MQPKRRMSRQSNLNFSNVDFQYIGDTSSVSHLIKRHVGGAAPNKVQLGYELNLRTYQCDTSFKAVEPWMFPKTKIFKAVECDKSSFNMFATTVNSPTNSSKQEFLLNSPSNSTSNAVSGPYNDLFRPRNMQHVRHSFTSGNISLSALREQANLRVDSVPAKGKIHVEE